MKPLRIEDEAEAELKAAADYYEEKRPGLSLAFGARIREAFYQIQDKPTRFPLYKNKPVRKCVITQFPYLV